MTKTSSTSPSRRRVRRQPKPKHNSSGLHELIDRVVSPREVAAALRENQFSGLDDWHQLPKDDLHRVAVTSLAAIIRNEGVKQTRQVLGAIETRGHADRDPYVALDTPRLIKQEDLGNDYFKPRQLRVIAEFQADKAYLQLTDAEGNHAIIAAKSLKPLLQILNGTAAPLVDAYLKREEASLRMLEAATGNPGEAR